MYDPVSAVIIAVGVFFGSQVVGATLFGIALLLVPGYAELSSAEIQRRLFANPWQYLGLIAAIDAVLVGAVRWFMKRRSISWHDIGFGGFKLDHVGLALAGYGAVFVGSIVSLAALAALFPGTNFDQEQNIGISRDLVGVELVPMFVALVVLAPLVEELLMRGFLYTNLRKRLSFAVSALIVSVLFSVAHINQTDEGLFLSGAVSFFVLSLVLCWVREKSGSIWPSVGVHALQNGIAFMAFYIWQLA
jgi:membrane protease YdiL (CAAX protease family)